MDIFCLATSDFGRLYSYLFLCLLEERSGTVISILTGINFRTEGSKYLELIFLQLFSLFGSCCHFPCMVCTGVLKQKDGWYLPVNQSGPKTRKSFFFSAHMRRGYWLRLHHQWLFMPAKYTHFQGCSKNLHRDATAFQIKYKVFLLLFNASCCLILLDIKTIWFSFLCSHEKILLICNIVPYLHCISQLRTSTFWIYLNPKSKVKLETSVRFYCLNIHPKKYHGKTENYM